MNYKMLETREDLEWLSKVHGIDTHLFAGAALYGNEDSPERVELYTSNNTITKPVVYIRYNGKIVRQKDALLDLIRRYSQRFAITKAPYAPISVVEKAEEVCKELMDQIVLIIEKDF